MRALSKIFHNKTVIAAVTTLLAITFFIGLSFLYKESWTASAGWYQATSDGMFLVYNLTNNALTISKSENGTGAMPDYSISNGPFWRNNFNWYKTMKTVNIESGITSIGAWAFYECSLTSITIPDTVTSIGDYAFQNCTSLTSITIPDTVTSIGVNAFMGCSNLNTIYLPSGATLELGAIPITASQIKYEVNDDGTVNITEIVPADGQTTVAIPETINGHTVVSVAKDYQQYVSGEHTHYSAGTATCTENAICAIGGETIYPAFGHDYDYDNPTFTWAEDYSECTATFTCKNDSSHTETYACEVSSEITIPATTKTEGERTYTATAEVDGKTYTDTAAEAVPKLPSTGSSSGGSSRRPSSSNTTTETTTTPSINGTQRIWADIAEQITVTTNSTSAIVVELNGATIVPAVVVKAIADSGNTVTFKVDGTFSWTIDGSAISGTISAIDLSIIYNSELVNANVTSQIGGEIKAEFTLQATIDAAKLAITTANSENGKFASLLKINPETGEAEFVSAAMIAENAVELDVAGSGDYILIIDTETKMPGDLTNDCKLNALDAAMYLRNIVSGVSADGFKYDYNGDGVTNAFDAADILRWVVSQ